jgi:hypothetical protein
MITNPAALIYGKLNEYLNIEQNTPAKKNTSNIKGLLRSTKPMNNKEVSSEPIARVTQYFKTIRQERNKLKGLDT